MSLQRMYDAGLTAMECCGDGHHRRGVGGVTNVLSSVDRSVEYILFEDGFVLGYLPSASGHTAYYPLEEITPQKPVEAILMDLDGTTVHSESFWIWIIELTMQSMRQDSSFSFTDADIPFVSGRSVTEHLSYCIEKYCPEASIATARQWYFTHTRREMAAIAEGHGRTDAFIPAEGVKEFLLQAKAHNIKLGLVTSGLYEKAYPEILSACKQLNLGAPEDFYDCIISAGAPLMKGSCGTLGELEPKPHPWLYAEAGSVGLQIPRTRRANVLGIEDSAAGVHAIKLAGYPCCGIGGGNIKASGVDKLCNYYCEDFETLWQTAIEPGK